MELAIVVGLICAAICAVMAENRNRSKIGWGFLGLLFGIFAVIVLAFLGKATPTGPVNLNG